MIAPSRIRRLIIPCFLVVSGTIAFAADWPQWRGPARTGYVPAGEIVLTTLPAAPQTIWHKEIGFSVASPVVNGGRVFYLDNQGEMETVHALDAKTGKETWAVPLDKVTHDLQSKPGPRTTPTADGDRLYAQSCRGQLKCLNAADGKVVWETNYVKDFGAVFIGETGKADGASRHGYTASPLIDGEHLIAEVGGKGAGIVCFDKKTGAVVWKSQDDMPGYAAPIIANIAGARQLVCFASTEVIGLDPETGTLLWRSPVKTSLGRHAATPVVVGNTVIVSSHQAGMIAIAITKEGSGFKAERAWVSKESAINYASPVVVGNFLYGVGPRKNLICVDGQTGKQAWSKDNFFSSSGGKAYAGMIVMGPNILVLDDAGQLILIAADSSGYREISRVQIGGTNWCNPAYADGRIYMNDAREIRCVQVAP